MTKSIHCYVAGVIASLVTVPVLAQAPADVSLTRFDCAPGSAPPADIGRFSMTVDGALSTSPASGDPH